MKSLILVTHLNPEGHICPTVQNYFGPTYMMKQIEKKVKNSSFDSINAFKICIMFFFSRFTPSPSVLEPSLSSKRSEKVLCRHMSELIVKPLMHFRSFRPILIISESKMQLGVFLKQNFFLITLISFPDLKGIHMLSQSF